VFLKVFTKDPLLPNIENNRTGEEYSNPTTKLVLAFTGVSVLNNVVTPDGWIVGWMGRWADKSYMSQKAE
jgi:hypothetical protein